MDLLAGFKKKRIILFDLDGTLTDPGVGITNSVMYALKKYGITVTERSTLYTFIGPPLIQSFEKFYGFNHESAEDAVTAYREYFSEKGIFENELYEGIDVLLSHLKEQGKILCLATSKPEVYAGRILEHFNLTKYFDIQAGSLLNGERTNKAEVIEWVMKQLRDKHGLESPEQEALMVGDREHDMAGAVKNHIPGVGVLYGYGSREELEMAGAKGLAAAVPELYKILTGNIFGR